MARPQTAPRAQARNADQMVQLLKQSATRQLILNGFAGLSIQRIVAEAGVSKGALFHHFPTKNHLIAAAFADLLTTFKMELDDLGLQLRRGEISRSAFVRGVVETFASDMFIGSMEIALAIRVEPDLSELVADAVTVWREGLSRFWTDTFALDLPADQVGGHWAMASNLLRGHAFTSTFGVEPEARSNFVSAFEDLILSKAVVKKAADQN
jgi:AcrR family transcriptional regulator